MSEMNNETKKATQCKRKVMQIIDKTFVRQKRGEKAPTKRQSPHVGNTVGMKIVFVLPVSVLPHLALITVKTQF